MLKVIIKTDNFAARMIKRGEARKAYAMKGMGFQARYALMDHVKRQRGKNKTTSKPGDIPNDHGTYRKTALFSVSVHSGEILAGFADYKAKGSNGRKAKVLTLGNNLAQDTLEYGGNIKQKVVYRDSRKNAPTKIIHIQARPHVAKAGLALFNGSKAYSRKFKWHQQKLIDLGYLKT